MLPRTVRCVNRRRAACDLIWGCVRHRREVSSRATRDEGWEVVWHTSPRRWRCSASERWEVVWRAAPCAPGFQRSCGIATRARARDLTDVGAEVEQTAEKAAARAGIVITMVTDADAVMSVATEQGMLGALAPDGDLDTDEHDRRCRDRACHVARRGSPPRRAPARRAGVGEQGTGRTRRAHDLRVRCGRGAALVWPQCSTR